MVTNVLWTHTCTHTNTNKDRKLIGSLDLILTRLPGSFWQKSTLDFGSVTMNHAKLPNWYLHACLIFITRL